MTNLPNPWLAGSTPRSAESPAVVSSPSVPLSETAAGPTLEPEQFVDLDAIDCIGEIFVGARKLELGPEPTILELMVRGFNVEAFLSDCEPLPMFLQGVA